MAQIKTTFTITVPYLFSPISAFSAESKLYNITLSFNVHETLQINQSYFLISKLYFSLLIHGYWVCKKQSLLKEGGLLEKHITTIKESFPVAPGQGNKK